MASRDLGIDPAGLHGAAAMVRAVPGPAPSGGAVTPCAGDCVSVDGANWLASQVGALDHAIATADQEAEAAAARLHASAGAYQQQESISAANLGGGAGAGGPVSTPAVLPASLPIPLAAPVSGGGIQPASGRQAAELIRGGPGPQAPQGLDATALALDTRAGRLDQASALVLAAREQLEHSWQSPAAEAARAQLTGLASRYARLATDARHLAGTARALAGAFRTTEPRMPDLYEWNQTIARLQAALAVNASPASFGTQGPTIRQLNMKLAAYERDSRTNFTDYQGAGTAHLVSGLPADTEVGRGGITGPGGAGALQPGAASRLDPPVANPADPMSNPLVGGAAGGMGKIMETIVPAVVTGVTGGVGGLLGAATGATSQLGGMTGQLASGLAQTASSAAGGAHPPGGAG
ncbi:PPE domain-containing protein, partial [Mycobacterium sp.]|uniref:PPE domain-containing protein n=1 Tax=Mycobacterium sp. TaxID=1785 RepID=UPI002B66879D